MSENESPRRKFLKILGLTAGATLVNQKAVAGLIDREDIKRLNPQQQEFMIQYGKWMDEFIDVIRIQKKDRSDSENNKKMIALTERAEQFKPRLTEFMKDETFSMIYKVSIERMRKEI